MLSDTSFSIAGHTFAISNFQLLIAAALLLGVAGLLLAFSRSRRVTLKRSVATDELYMQLGRIAEALERIANQSSDRIIAEASRRVETPPPTPPTKLSEETHGIPYSMFGR
jgi:hypothetical protein